jgi:hypothetical protein
MARHEADREDLLREATALVDRVEWILPDREDPVVLGFRRDGSGSVYFGADPALHFNAAGELRRSFYEGLLVKAERGRLVALTRQRSPQQVELLRDVWDDERTGRFLARTQELLETLHRALHAGACRETGRVTEDDEFDGRVERWLDSLRTGIRIAQRPHAG